MPGFSLFLSLSLSLSLSLRSNNAIFLSSLPPLFGSVPSTLLAGCWWVGLACFRRPRGFFFLVFRSSLVNLCTGDQLHVKRGRPFSRSWGAWVSGDGRRAGARQPPRRAEEAAPQETRTERREARGQGIPCPCLQLARVVLQPWNVQIRWVFFRPARNFLAGMILDAIERDRRLFGDCGGSNFWQIGRNAWLLLEKFVERIFFFFF